MISSALKVGLLTALAMISFALNSILNRIVFSPDFSLGYISPGQFAAVRMIAGAIMLAILVALFSKTPPNLKHFKSLGSWPGGLSLLIYAAGFSFAYIALPAGTGALILFGCVQLTMLCAGYIMGERLRVLQWLGFGLAIAGLLWMLWPSESGEFLPLWAIASMAGAGMGWGAYSLLGRRENRSTPLERTSGNFIRASLLAIPLYFILTNTKAENMPDALPVLVAIICGGVTSGLGYAIWYAALRGLSSSQAAIAQLTVPVLAAIGGLLFLSEPITWRFINSSLLVLGGVALALLIQTKQID